MKHGIAIGATGTLALLAGALWALYRYLPDPGPVRKVEVTFRPAQDFMRATPTQEGGEGK